MPKYEDCLACHGTGFVTIDGQQEGCPRCAGRGLREAR